MRPLACALALSLLSCGGSDPGPGNGTTTVHGSTGGASIVSAADAQAFVLAGSGSAPDGVIVLISDKAGVCAAAAADHFLPNSGRLALVLYPVQGAVAPGSYAIGSGGNGSASSPFGVFAFLLARDGTCSQNNELGGRAFSGSITLSSIGASGVAGTFTLTMGPLSSQSGSDAVTGTFSAGGCALGSVAMQHLFDDGGDMNGCGQ